MLLLAALFIIPYVSYVLYGRLKYYNVSKCLKSYHWEVPLLGHTYLFFGYNQRYLFTRLNSLFRDAVEHDKLFKFWLGTRFVLVILDPEYTKKIIFNQELLHKDDILAPADPIVGRGMLFGSGPEVRMHRKHFLTAFNTKILESYISVFDKHSDILIQILGDTLKRHESTRLHIEKYLHYCTFDAVNETTIGLNTNTQRTLHYRELCIKLIDIYGVLYQDVVKPWIYYSRRLLRALGLDHVQKTCNIFNNHLYKALIEKREEINSKTKVDSEIITTLEFILRKSSGIPDDEIIVELKNIFMASADTVAQTAAFLIKMFAVHQEYQEQAYQECKTVTGGSNDMTINISLLSKLSFIDKCIKETLRLFPIAPLLVRKATRGIDLDDIKVPEGTTILLGVYWLHRSERHWQRAKEFYPGHFDSSEVRSQGSYVPFSGGAHSCIGQNYAMLFLKTLILKLILKYRILPVNEDYINGIHRKEIPLDYVNRMKLTTDISIRLCDGVQVNLEAR